MTRTPTTRRGALIALTALCAAALAACGGGGDSGSGSTSTPTTPAGGNGTQGVAGVLVSPTAIATASQAVLEHAASAHRVRKQSVACPSVPDGYDPLASVTITFKDANANTVATLNTDACGGFSGTVPDTATSVSAAPTGTAPINQPISAVTASTPAVVSALPANATLLISVLQDLGGGKLALSVTDSATGKSVLGLPAASFSFALAGTAAAASSVSYGASTADAASVAIVLDASGSMEFTSGGSQKTKIQLASAATHELLGGLVSGTDEAGITIFDDTVTTMNDASLASQKFSWANAAGAATAPYTVSASGLTQSIARLSPIADLYDVSSQIYLGSPGNPDPVAADTGDVRLLSSYGFGGATAFYDAASAGISLLGGGLNARRIVVAMTDGIDNSSTATKDQVIAAAQAAKLPLYLVAFGSTSEVDEPTMQDMAQQTGGEYKRVEGDDITGLFQSIQTGIRFQYVAAFPSAFASGATLTATVTASGLTVSRDLAIH